MVTANHIPPGALPDGEAEPFEVDLSELPEWQLAQRIAASKSFSKSAFLPRFLLYVCYQKLVGNGHLINETRLGIDVFHRPENYSPAEDNIVRNYARILRKRIEGYFQREGPFESIHLTIPRGGYIPVFEYSQPREEQRTVKDASPDEADLPSQDENPVSKSALFSPVAARRRIPARLRLPASFFLGAVLCLAAVIILVSTGILRWNIPTHTGSNAAGMPVWRAMFQQKEDTLIVPTDSGLGILQNLTHQPITLTQYLNGSSLKSGRNNSSLIDLQSQHYTSLVSLDIILGLTRMTMFNPSRCFIRYPRFLSIRDFRDFNVILLGSIHANPWVSLFQDQLNFRPFFLPTVNDSYILNLQPRKGEQAIYRNQSGPEHHITYGVIDYLPNLNASGHILLVQGLSMAGTQAAANVLMQSPDLDRWIRAALEPDGSLRPFELLVRCDTLEADAPTGEIIAMHVHSKTITG